MLGGLIMLFLLSVLVGGIYLFFLPTISAKRRNHPNTAAIFLVNLFFGWTFLGWFVALLWACSRPAYPILYAPQYPRSAAYPLTGQVVFPPHGPAALTASRFQGQR